MRGIPLIINFLLLTACASSPWQWQGIPDGYSHFSSIRLTYPISSCGLRLEFFRSDAGVEALLSAVSVPLGALNHQKILISVSEEGGRIWEETIPLMGGNMRLRLSPELVEWMISTLFEGNSLSLEIDGKKTLIDAKGFRPLWEKKAELQFRLRQ